MTLDALGQLFGLLLVRRGVITQDELFEATHEANVVFISRWIDRMTERYGSSVHDQSGDVWDWGQALCRECYGLNWSDVIPENPTDNDVGIAKEWEQGGHPTWVKEIY